jgi:multiple sugar transport system ATP-binding protein
MSQSQTHRSMRRMASVELRGISKRFGAVQALRDVTLTVHDGEFLTLLGPSGCGKSTLLRIVAGLEQPTAGEVRLDSRSVIALAPKQRNVAMVFQSYALYPHMKVFDNIALPLVMRRLDTWRRLPGLGGLLPGARAAHAAIDREVRDVAGALGIEALLGRKPAQLSGGQKQRVALARAMVRRPAVFLMDEPLSNLDARLRVQMRAELAELHRRLAATLIYVTHDQVEAMTMSDRVAVMIDGQVLQVASPRAIYADPDSLAVAEFVGTPRINVLPACRRADGALDVLGVTLPRAAPAGAAGPGLRVAVRPEALALDEPVSPRSLTGRVRLLEDLGPETLVHVAVQGLDTLLVARCEPAAVVGLLIDDEVGVRFAPGDGLLFDRNGCRVRGDRAAAHV